MADYARLCRDAGVRIIGGCCGTTPAHLAAMHRVLLEYEPGERPSLGTVVERLGGISRGAQRLAEDGEPPADARAAPTGRRRGGRRR